MATNGENSHQLQSLSQKHKNVASLLAQGTLKYYQIAEAVGITPEYVSWLTRDPLFREELKRMTDFEETRLEAMFGRVVDAVDDGLKSGNTEEALKAARLQLEVTGRIGKNERPSSANDSSIERLTTLAERLLNLQTKVRNGETFDVNPSRIPNEPSANTG